MSKIAYPHETDIRNVSYCRFRSITKQYFRKADGVLVMYDVNSEVSFTNVRNWIGSVQVRHLFSYFVVRVFVKIYYFVDAKLMYYRKVSKREQY